MSSTINLRRLDLNLLVVFDAVMAERSVTRGAQRVFLTQSAVSSALGRLRHQLGDELFLRGPGKLRPTPRALEIEEPVRALLAELQQVLAPATFNPATEHRRFTIATNDYFTAVVAPPLARRLARVAPGVDVNIVPTAGRALEMLDAREADVVCTSWGQLPERFATATLVQDEYVCVVRKDHPFARKPPTLRQFAQAKHRLVSPRGDAHGFVDERLAEKGLTRRIVMNGEPLCRRAADRGRNRRRADGAAADRSTLCAAAQHGAAAVPGGRAAFHHAAEHDLARAAVASAALRSCPCGRRWVWPPGPGSPR
jgi:DNA-binding transcriptional LysR family regulator